MADFSTLLSANETADDVAEAFDSGLTEQHQDLADHVRCGKFENLIGKANRMTQEKTLSAQAKIKKSGDGMLCVTGQDVNTAVTLEKDLSRLSRVNASLREKEAVEAMRELADKSTLKLSKDRVAVDVLKHNSAYAADVTGLNPMSDDVMMEEEDDLERLRTARMAQLRREKLMTDRWRDMGHGKLGFIPSEREFFSMVKGRERSVVVINDAGGEDGTRGNNFMSSLAKIAEKHIETGVFHMHAENARFMLSMVETTGLPVLFILRHGEVICRIGKDILQDPNLSGDPSKLERLLKSRDAFGEGLGHEDKSESGGESEDDENTSKKKLHWNCKKWDFNETKTVNIHLPL